MTEKIELFPGSKLTPEIVLNRTTAKLGRIKGIIAIIQWDDDTYDCDWSSMKLSELCMAKDFLTIQIHETIRKSE